MFVKLKDERKQNAPQGAKELKMKKISKTSVKKFIKSLSYIPCPIQIIFSFSNEKLDIRAGCYSDGRCLTPSWTVKGYRVDEEAIERFVQEINS